MSIANKRLNFFLWYFKELYAGDDDDDDDNNNNNKYFKIQYSYKMFALLWYYAAYTDNFLPTFRENLSVSSSSVTKSKKKTGKPKC